MPAPPEKVQRLAEELKKISDSLASEQTSQLTPSHARRVRKTISEAYENLRKVMADLDPVKHPGFVFDPSNPNVVGRLVGITMVAQDRKPLAAVERFYGSGIYAIFYNGDFRSYKRCRRKSTRYTPARPTPLTLQARPLWIKVTDLPGAWVTTAGISQRQIPRCGWMTSNTGLSWCKRGGKMPPKLTSSTFSSRYGTTKSVFATALENMATTPKHARTCGRRGIPCIPGAIGLIAIKK